MNMDEDKKGNSWYSDKTENKKVFGIFLCYYVDFLY